MVVCVRNCVLLCVCTSGFVGVKECVNVFLIEMGLVEWVDLCVPAIVIKRDK